MEGFLDPFWETNPGAGPHRGDEASPRSPSSAASLNSSMARLGSSSVVSCPE